MFACDKTDNDLMIQQNHCRERLKLKIYNAILTLLMRPHKSNSSHLTFRLCELSMGFK